MYLVGTILQQDLKNSIISQRGKERLKTYDIHSKHANSGPLSVEKHELTQTVFFFTNLAIKV